MGLDMYLFKEKRAVPKAPTVKRCDVDFPSDILHGVTYKDGKIVAVMIRDGDGVKTFTPEPAHIMSISDEVAYWRKANYIHKWFVDRVQGGVDDCRTHSEVTEDVLRDLVSTCKEVLANRNRAHELLPTMDGFFFGSTKYDDDYFREVESTVEKIETIIRETDFKSEAIYYSSSW